MRRTLRLLTLLPFLLAPTPARAADWVSVAKFSDVELEFDLAGAVREGDFSRAWDRATYQADQGGPGSGDVAFRIAKTLIRYDCTRRTVVPLVRVFTRSDGVEIQRLHLEGAELPQPVVPDTPRERMLSMACRAKSITPPTPAIRSAVMPADGSSQPADGSAGAARKDDGTKGGKVASKPGPKPSGKATKPEAAPNGKEEGKAASAEDPKAAAKPATTDPKKPEPAAKAPPKAEPGKLPVTAKTPVAHGEPADAHGKPGQAPKVAEKSNGHGKPGKAEKAEEDDANEKEAPAHHAHWTYAGPTGAANWARLSPEYAQCAQGKRQSPIDIKDGVRVQLEGVKFDYKPSALKVTNNGHTIQVGYDPGSTINVAGVTYELVQFHFHRPAEERVNGRPFDMVVHLVHKSKDGQLAVVAVLMMPGDENAFIKTVWNHLPLDVGLDEAPTGVNIDMNQLLPKLRGYYTYVGSLTTPPCTEGVRWIVLRTPVQVSRTQISTFGRLYEMNARPIQPAHSRLIKEVF